MPASKSATTVKTSKPKPSSSRHFGVRLLTSQHKDIKRLKKEYPTSIHGNKFWGSSYLVMDYLKENPLKKGAKVLELGCGWGLASIYMAKQFDAQVTAVDADSDVFPYLELHADINHVSINTLTQRFEKLTKKYLSQFDIIIAADVCFWDELSPIHFNLIRRALTAGVEKIIYADPERSPFLELAERCTEAFYADVFEHSLSKPVKARGALMVIENA